MDGLENIQGATEDKKELSELEAWEAAFDSLEPEVPSDAPGDAGDSAPAANADGQADNQAQLGDEVQPGEPAPGPGVDNGVDGVENVVDSAPTATVSQADIDAAVKEAEDAATEKAVNAVVERFMGLKDIRRSNGKLGATIQDPDICKKAADGSVAFYNPETGKRFTGDNPRRQAQEWVDDYNRELGNVFNQEVEKAKAQFLDGEMPRVRVLQFASTYDNLDPVRQNMLDSIIEDYEVRDGDGELVGYSCDLNKALGQVNKMVEKMKSYAASRPKPPTGPATDMKTSSGVAQPPKMKREDVDSIEAAFDFLAQEGM